MADSPAAFLFFGNMNKSGCYQLGHITKVFGTNGELVFFLDVDVPENYKGLESVFIENDEGLVQFLIQNIRINKNFAYVKLKDIDKIEQAEKFLKLQLYLPLSSLPLLKGNNFYIHEVIGFRVIDQLHGDIGTLASMLELPGQRILQVMKENKEILIPLHLDFIDKVDRAGKILYINTPPGLIDIYLSNSSKAEE